MKHAYLILAHHEFEYLQCLIDVLDDYRNDIYLHFDKKVKNMPNLSTRFSSLHILDERIDSRWGDFSLIEAELALFKAVKGKQYLFCHLISGVHLPLYSQDYIHQFYQNNAGTQLFFELTTNDYEPTMKIKRYSFFMQYYAHNNKIISQLAQFGWKFCLKIQHLIGLDRRQYQKYMKASQWLSLTQEAIDYLVGEEVKIKKAFKYTFCGDEFFVPTVLINSNVKWDLKFENRLLIQRMDLGKATVFTLSDYDYLLNSNCLFARKFSNDEKNVVDKVIASYTHRN